MQGESPRFRGAKVGFFDDVTNFFSVFRDEKKLFGDKVRPDGRWYHNKDAAASVNPLE